METLYQTERDRLVTDRILSADTEEGSDDKVKGLQFSDSFVLTWLILSAQYCHNPCPAQLTVTNVLKNLSKQQPSFGLRCITSCRSESSKY